MNYADVLKDRAFAVWSFGEFTWNQYTWGLATKTDLINAWNKLHGHIRKFDMSGTLSEDAQTMRELYDEQITNQTKGQAGGIPKAIQPIRKRNSRRDIKP